MSGSNRLYVLGLACVALAACSEAQRTQPAPDRPPTPGPSAPAPTSPTITAEEVGDLLVTAAYNVDAYPDHRASIAVEKHPLVIRCMQQLLLAAAVKGGEVAQMQAELDRRLQQTVPGARPTSAQNDYLSVVMDGNIVKTAFEAPDQLQGNQWYQLRKLSLDTLRQTAPLIEPIIGMSVDQLIDTYRPLQLSIYSNMVRYACSI